MRTAALLLFLICVACSKASNSFVVRVDEGAATAAKLRLCGAEVPLNKAGNRFTLVRRSSCEGAGEILIVFSDREPISCPIGYVTPGADQVVSFVVNKQGCMPLAS